MSRNRFSLLERVGRVFFCKQLAIKIWRKCSLKTPLTQKNIYFVTFYYCTVLLNLPYPLFLRMFMFPLFLRLFMFPLFLRVFMFPLFLLLMFPLFLRMFMFPLFLRMLMFPLFLRMFRTTVLVWPCWLAAGLATTSPLAGNKPILSPAIGLKSCQLIDTVAQCTSY